MTIRPLSSGFSQERRKVHSKVLSRIKTVVQTFFYSDSRKDAMSAKTGLPSKAVGGLWALALQGSAYGIVIEKMEVLSRIPNINSGLCTM